MDNKDFNKETMSAIELMIADGVITIETAEKYFPSFKVSEDERIRKELIDYFSASHATFTFRGIPWDRVVAWLDKQGEQKPDTDFLDLRTWKYVVDTVLTEKDGIGQYLDSLFTEEVAKKLLKRFGVVEPKPLFDDDEKRDIWEYLEKFKSRYGHYPKDADELSAVLYGLLKTWKRK